MEFYRGVVRSYDSATHTATVLLIGSLASVVVGIPVAQQVGPESMVEGAACGVLFSRGGASGVVVCTVDGGGVSAGCRVSRSVAKSIANTTWTAIDYDVEEWDALGMHDNVTLNTRVTCVVAGKYGAVAGVVWGASAAGTYRVVEIQVNGVRLARERRGASAYAAMVVSGVVSLVVGDYVEVYVEQDSGGALTGVVWAGVHRIGG